MSELFDLPESKSPRLQWMEKHGIGTSPPIKGMYGILCKWMAHNQAKLITMEATYAETEDEAIVQLALKLGIKLWNEEVQQLTQEISHAEENVPVHQLAQGYIRYEKLRLLSARAYAELSRQNVEERIPFNDLVDGLEAPK